MLRLSQQTRSGLAIGSERVTASRPTRPVADAWYWERFPDALLRALSAWTV